MISIKREPASPPDKSDPTAGLQRSHNDRTSMEAMVAGNYGVLDHTAAAGSNAAPSGGNEMLMENGDVPNKRQRVAGPPGTSSTSPNWGT